MVRDLFWALRSLRKDPFLTAVTVAILAVGIGANTAIFSIVDAVLLRPLPYASADRLVRIEESSTSRTMAGVPVKDYSRWSARSDIFGAIVPYLRDTVTLIGDGEPEQVIAVRSIGLLPLLGVPARLGRTLTAVDDAEGAASVVTISDRLWRRRYHADPNVLGRSITISGAPYTIVGVMPPDFEFRYPDAEAWMPLQLTPTSPWVQVAGRLRAGVSLQQARSALGIVAHQMEKEQPKDRAGFRIVVTPWSDTPDQRYRLTLIFALAAVGLVMLIACADVGGLLLSRAVRRQKEIAIRASLGAGRWRLVRQMLSESFVLAVVGSFAGIALARLLLQLLTQQLAALPIVLPHLQRVALDGRVIAFSAILCFLLAVLCSLAPGLLVIGTDLQAVLRRGQAVAGLRGSGRLFSTLIAAEVAMAFLLLVGSGLMIRSVIQLQQEDRGLQPQNVLTLRVPVGTHTQPRPTGKYDTRQRQMAYYREILESVKAIPGIKFAAIVNNPPLSGVSSSLSFHFGGGEGEAQLTSARTISPEYFAAMGIPLLAGRTFTDSDKTGSPGVAIINEYLARQLFADKNPIGQHLVDAESKTPGPAIVGVVRNTPQMSYELAPKGEVYIPYQQFMFATFMSTLVVRSESDPAALISAVKKKVWEVDPTQPVVKVETMEQVIANSIWRPRFSAWIFSCLGVLSILLTAMGVYSVVAYTSTLRTREVGIRMALGANQQEILAVILQRALTPVISGLACGIVAALLLARLLTNLLYGISTYDPVTYMSSGLLMLIVGASATARPAWQAATSDPLHALRAE